MDTTSTTAWCLRTCACTDSFDLSFELERTDPALRWSIRYCSLPMFPVTCRLQHLVHSNMSCLFSASQRICAAPTPQFESCSCKCGAFQWSGSIHVATHRHSKWSPFDESRPYPPRGGIGVNAVPFGYTLCLVYSRPRVVANDRGRSIHRLLLVEYPRAA